MPLRDAYYPLLADPSPESWREICRLLDLAGSDEARAAEAAVLRDEFVAWPPEVERAAPVHWGKPLYALRRDLLALCRTVAEKDLYPLYIEAAASSPLLRLRDGTPAVRLQRQFTGALQGSHGRIHRVGQEGQGDLSGSLCVEYEYSTPEHEAALLGYSKGWCACPGDHPFRRLAIALEVEVKRDAGKMRPAQVTRQEALRRRGEIYIVVRRTEEMVRLLVAERDRVLDEMKVRS